MSMSISYVRTHIYIEDMHTKKVNECAVTSERIVFSYVAWILLVSVFCGSGVVSGIRGKQMTP